MNYRKRREKLEKKLEEYSYTLVYAGDEKQSAGDENYPFEVNRDFYYLTGIDRPRIYLGIWKDPRGVQESLFLERYDERMARWVGGKIRPEEAREISGVESIHYLDELEDTLGFYLGRFSSEVTLGACFRRESVGQEDDGLTREVRRIRRHYPALKVQDVSRHVTELRLVKDREEIRQIQEGIRITDRGLQRMWKSLRSGKNESEMEAWFDFELKKDQAAHSFSPIFASGRNATTLHYSQNDTVMEKGSLLLTDLGAAVHHYCADITRTVPVDGEFTPRQREVYDVVLRCNRHIIAYAKAGMTLRQLNEETVRFYERELPGIGLLQKGHSLEEYYFHSVSHMLGLECHDVDLPQFKLREGNVFTVEPGLYIEEEGIGIRIEDDVAMQDGKAVVLSEGIVKEPSRIEEFLKK